MEEPKHRPDQSPPARKPGSPGVRTPIEGESSSSQNVPFPDSPTMADPVIKKPPPAFDPDATLVDIDATLVDVAPRRPAPRSSAGSRASGLFVSAAILQEGDVLGGRYEILQLLGEGGMGAVYKARDRELDSFTALKLIRPELASSPAILARFKQELLLAHQVTHKNVIRVYDLSEADGVKFITMEFVEGVDLRHLLLERGKLPPAEAVEIMRQVCVALEAAHTVGVIHRDLKPQNIMQDKQGRILVMDFGLARSVDSEGMTQTGALVGTMEYMSPEQAMGGDLDQRSDLFALGLIFFELLTGKMPYKADTALASLLKRNQERAIPAVNLDPTIPQGLSDIVAKCLERDVNARYQNVSQVLSDLDAWEGKRPVSASTGEALRRLIVPVLRWKWILTAVLLVLVAVGGWMLRGKGSTTGTTETPAAVRGPVTSLAILPFRNASGDPSLDWLGPSLAEMLSTDVGQSSQLRTVSPNRLHQIFADLRISPSSALDPTVIRRVADFSTADRVVWGQYAKFGDQIRIDATLQDIKNDRTFPLKADIPSEKEIPGAIDRLAESIRQTLALPADALKEMKASSFQPVSQSVDALRDYNQGIALQRDGKNLEAQKQFEAATKEDPNFALAFSRLGQIYSTLGYDSEAEQAAGKAVNLSQNLPQAEKYLISAVRSQVTKNYPEAIKAYENLEKISPDNADVQLALGSLYKDSGNLTKSREYYQKLLSANPKDITATMELGRLAIKSGDPQGGLDPLNRAYTLAVEVDNPEQKATSLHLMATAYEMLSKPEESLRNEQQAVAIWKQIGQQRGLALSLKEMARVQASLGKSKDASANFDQALQLQRQIGDKAGLGDTLIDLGNFQDDQGDHDQALKTYKEALQLQRDLGNESLQAICLNNIGSVYSNKGQYEDALTYFQQALQLREKSKAPQDIVEAVHNLGYTSTSMGQYDKAVSYYLRALDLRRSMDDPRGAAIESYSLGGLFDFQGRFGAAINSTQEALKTFRDIKEKTFWMAKMLGGYAEALILAGRGDEVKSYLDEGLSLSRELKNDGMVAEILGIQGDKYFYAGDFNSAQSSYTQALEAATRSKEPDTILIANAKLAKVQVQEKRTQAAISSLRKVIQHADELGLKYVSVESSVSLGEALMQSRDAAGARQELERALQLADKLGMRPLSVRAHYLLAMLERDSGNVSDAQNHYREALRLLDEMKKDPGAEKLLQRADFKTIYDASTRGAQATKN